MKLGRKVYREIYINCNSNYIPIIFFNFVIEQCFIAFTGNS